MPGWKARTNASAVSGPSLAWMVAARAGGCTTAVTVIVASAVSVDCPLWNEKRTVAAPPAETPVNVTWPCASVVALPSEPTPATICTPAPATGLSAWSRSVSSCCAAPVTVAVAGMPAIEVTVGSSGGVGTLIVCACSAPAWVA